MPVWKNTWYCSAGVQTDTCIQLMALVNVQYYIYIKKKRRKYSYNSEFSRRISLIIWSRVGLEKCLLMLRVFLYQRRGMKYLLVLLEFLIVYVGGYPGVFLKSCSLSSSGDGTCILVARDRCCFFYVSHAVPQCCCTALLHGC